MLNNYIGQRFGDYELTDILGRGGFATVYKGEHVSKKTFAAVKIFSEQKTDDFFDELNPMLSLQHPHIVKIRSFPIHPSYHVPFIIMDYASNGSLRKKHPKGEQVSLATVVSYVKQAAQALQYAHDNKIIHRDVKPDNLLLDEHNNVLLSDFSIATVRATTTTFTVQQDAKFIGTPPYMAPEQFRGKHQPASDQYALALVAYELLCGELPFDGASDLLQWSHLRQNVEPPLLRDKVPILAQEVEQVILKALSKQAADRFTCIEDFATYLEHAAKGQALDLQVTVERSSNRLNPSLAGKQTGIPSQIPLSPIEQLIRDAVQAQSRSEPERAYDLYQKIASTTDVPPHYVKVVHDEIKNLRPKIVQLICKRADEAALQGRWQDEIGAWEELLTLNPSEWETGSPLTLDPPKGDIKQRIQERIHISRRI